ncbi:MAG TPA: hypothetical protein ENN34_05700 [Deltaproteobacteria bacterium]|nr:hypothetical protein [Deltaproteobacteria bacterium]HDP24921.1 hypothetical protein [Deltaproteobacteria bacterium]
MKKVKGVFILFTVLVLSLFLAAGTLQADEGVTDTEIKIASIVDLSGPIAFMGKGVTDGARLYFEYINDHGGIHGRKINYWVEDDGYQSPRAMVAARRIIERDKVFSIFLVLGSTAVNAMYPFTSSRGVPILCPGTQNREMGIPPRKYLFMPDPTYTDMGKLAVEWLVDDLKVENLRIAVLYQDDSPGHDWVRGVEIGTEHYGMEIVARLPYKRGAVDFSSQVSRAKEAGVTHILMWTLVREPGMLLQEAMRQEFKATYITAVPSMTKMVLDLAGEAAINYTNGFYSTSLIIDPPREGGETVKLFYENVDKYGIGSKDNFYNHYGYQHAITLVEGLKRAGRDLTREGLIKALESLENFDNGFLAPITFGPDRRIGTDAVKMFQAIGGEWRTIMDEWRPSNIEKR